MKGDFQYENQNYSSNLFRFPGGLPGGKYAEIKTQQQQFLKLQRPMEPLKLLTASMATTITGSQNVLSML